MRSRLCVPSMDIESTQNLNVHLMSIPEHRALFFSPGIYRAPLADPLELIDRAKRHIRLKAVL